MARSSRSVNAGVERAAVRACSALPAWAQRLLFGAPPSIDGQRLALDIHVLLRLAELVGRPSLTGGLTTEQARANARADASATAGKPIPMAKVRELHFQGAAGPLPARFYLPPSAPPSPRPLLLYFHGGGWVICDLDTHDSVCRFLAAHSGAAVLAPGYRLAPEHPFPAAIEDAESAFRWAVANAEELGIDPNRIAVGGDSAGGNMATGLCQTTRDDGGPRPAMQLLIYPVTDAIGERPSRGLFATGFKLTKGDIDEFERCYVPNPSLRAEPLASVLRAPDLSGLPPACIVTAGFDPLRDEGEEYAARLRREGVAVAHRRYPGLIHTFANLTAVSGSARAAMLEMAGALRMGLA